MAEDNQHLLLADRRFRPDQEQLLEDAFAAMEAGSTLNAVAVQAGVAPATIWAWIGASEELLHRYESVKVARSRSLMEHALYEMQCALTLDEVKIASYRAKTYLMHAARLNPKEFSEKLHHAQGKQGQGARVSFNLSFNGAPQQHMGELTVIEDTSE